MSGKRNLSVCSGHELANALYVVNLFPRICKVNCPHTNETFHYLRLAYLFILELVPAFKLSGLNWHHSRLEWKYPRFCGRVKIFTQSFLHCA